jgi:hypothetical protein
VQIFGDRIEYFETDYDALDGADALIILTESNEFRHPNFQRIKEALKQPTIFDGRNLMIRRFFSGPNTTRIDFRGYEHAVQTVFNSPCQVTRKCPTLPACGESHKPAKFGIETDAHSLGLGLSTMSASLRIPLLRVSIFSPKLSSA